MFDQVAGKKKEKEDAHSPGLLEFISKSSPFPPSQFNWYLDCSWDTEMMHRWTEVILLRLTSESRKVVVKKVIWNMDVGRDIWENTFRLPCLVLFVHLWMGRVISAFISNATSLKNLKLKFKSGLRFTSNEMKKKHASTKNAWSMRERILKKRTQFFSKTSWVARFVSAAQGMKNKSCYFIWVTIQEWMFYFLESYA